MLTDNITVEQFVAIRCREAREDALEEGLEKGRGEGRVEEREKYQVIVAEYEAENARLRAELEALLIK